MALDEEQTKRAVMWVYILSLFMQIVDGTIVNVAVPTLAEEFDVSEGKLGWAIIGYLISLAVFIPASGRLGDSFGTKRVFMLSLLLFTGSSTLCGLSTTFGQLVGFRVIQGIGAGLMAPIGAAMLYRAFPQSERAKAATAVIGVAVVAPAMGPVLGGVILETLNWRWIFFVNIPIGLLALTMTAKVITEYRGDREGTFDVVGFVLAGAGLALTLFAVSEGPHQGWTSAPILLGLAAGIACITAFVSWEQRTRFPLLELSLLKDKHFRTSILVGFPTYMGFMALIFILPLYLQSLRGFTALDSGLATFPQALGVMTSSQLVGRLVYSRVGPRRLMIGGAVAALLIGLVFATLDMQSSLWTVRGLNYVRGLAMGTIFVSMQASVYATTSNADTGQATALFTVVRQSAPAFGVALAGTALSSLASSANGLDPGLDAYRWAMVAAALMFVPAIAAAWQLDDSDAAETMKR